MKYLNILILFMMISVTGYAQDEVSPEYRIVDSYGQGPIEQLSLHQFQSGDHIGKLHEFDYLFLYDERTANLFYRFDKARKHERVANYAALGTIVASGVTFGIALQDFDIPFLSGFGVGSILGVVPALGITLINLITSKRNKNKYRSELFSQINPNFVKQHKHQPNLDLRLTEYGVGLVFNF